MRPDWQIVATAACILIAGIVVMRQVIGLFSTAGTRTCGTCSTCPGKQKEGPSNSAEGFVSLDAVITSSRTISSTTLNERADHRAISS